jgi:hypothetical protein
VWGSNQQANPVKSIIARRAANTAANWNDLAQATSWKYSTDFNCPLGVLPENIVIIHPTTASDRQFGCYQNRFG